MAIHMAFPRLNANPSQKNNKHPLVTKNTNGLINAFSIPNEVVSNPH